MAKSGFYVHVEGFEGFDRSIDFDKKQIRRAMRQAGALVVKDARGRVTKQGASKGGGYPSRRTGRLAKSIRAKVSRSGFLVRIEPKTGKDVPASDPYFAYLYYGVRRGATRRKDHKAQSSGPYRVQPRANYMADALEAQAGPVRNLLSAALAAGLRVK
ncbi:hypothetical protein AB4Z48_17710 [Cupriavidus sp. 2TAF22]|uniref:HK97 gp10 family phage protein n=1 Tax=unclassified Cupriavidus TaxID=2640874 RepID=UPI003F93DF75